MWWVWEQIHAPEYRVDDHHRVLRHRVARVSTSDTHVLNPVEERLLRLIAELQVKVAVVYDKMTDSGGEA